MMRVYVDQVQCTGSMVCEMVAPVVFIMDDEGLATVLADGVALADGGAPLGVAVSADHEALVRDAIATCPGGCIHISEG